MGRNGWSGLHARRLLGITLLLALILGSVTYLLATGGADPGQRQDGPSEEWRRRAMDASRTYALGESFDVVGNEDTDMPTYLSSLGWVGTLRFRVTDAAVYDSVEEAGLSDVRFKREGPLAEGVRIVRVDIEVENVDAHPTTRTRMDHVWFMAPWGLTKGDAQQAGELMWFSGTPSDAVEEEALSFDLPQGASATYRLGFYTSSFDDSKDYSLDFNHGGGSTIGSCVVELGRVREGEA